MKPIVENWNYIAKLQPSQFKVIKDNDIDLIIYVQKGDEIEGLADSNHGQSPSADKSLADSDKLAKRPDLRRMECMDNEGGSTDNSKSLPDADGVASGLGITYKKFTLGELSFYFKKCVPSLPK